MKLVNSKYNLKMNLNENETVLLVIEKALFQRELIQMLDWQIKGEQGDFILSEKEEEISISKNISMILDPFSIEFNDKKVLNKIYSELTHIAVEYSEEKENINAAIVKLLDEIIEQSRYDGLVMNMELEWLQLLKLYNIRLEAEMIDFFPKLLEYMKVQAHILERKVLCLVNVKSFLEEDELLELYKMAVYLKIQLLLIESRETKVLPGERRFVIDKDRCIIVE